MEDPGGAVHRRVAAARRGRLPHVGDHRPDPGDHRAAPGGGAAGAGRRRRGLPVVLRADEGELPRSRQRDRGGAHHARLRAGRRPGSAARAHPGGRSRRRRMGAVRRRCRPGRTRRRRRWSRWRPAPGASRAAHSRADLRNLARDLRELPGAARGDGEGARPGSRAAADPSRASCAASASRCWWCWCSRPSSGLVVARRATGRVAALRDAARRVGEGDLSVRVAPRGNDELDELARAFDCMVAELGDARSRLGYLQKVSAWQEVARRLAHEIKNPLTPIQLAVQELGSKYRGDDPEYRRLAGDRAGDPERGGRRDPPPGRRLLGVREAAQGRTGAGRSRPGRRGFRARAPRVAGVPARRAQRRRWARCAIGCCCATCWRTWSRTRCRPPRRPGASRRSGSRSTRQPGRPRRAPDRRRQRPRRARRTRASASSIPT